MYDRVEEARMRLGNTVIRYDGIPCYVEDVGLCDDYAREFTGDDEDYDWDDLYNRRTPQEYIHVLVCFKDQPSQSFSIDDEKFDFEPVPLGYTASPLRSVDNVRNPCYLWRETGRQYKQGLHSRTLHQVDIEEVTSRRQRQPLNIFGQILCDTILGKYETLEDTLHFLEHDITEEEYQRKQVFPFHREYALSVNTFGQLYLWHRTDRIATSEDGEVFHTLAEYAHLKEDLEEITKGVLKIASYA